jgi:predicted RNase H-like HicB family nuclease
MTDFLELADQYLVLIEGGPPSNYSAWSPDVRGCVATGATIEEVRAEMREALAFHLEGLADAGEPLPEPSGPGVYVELDPRAAA